MTTTDAAPAGQQTDAANAANQAANAANAAPGANQNPAAPAAPAAPAPAAQAAALNLPTMDPDGKPWTAESLYAELTKVRGEAARKRTASKNVTDALRAVAAEVGIELPDGEPTVEGLTQTVQTITGERDQANTRAGEAEKARIYAEEAWKAGVPYDRAQYLTFLLSQNPALGGTALGADNAAEFRGTVASTITNLRASDPVLQAAGGGQGASGPDSFGGANGGTAVTQEQFDAMDYDARLALFQKNPEEYRRLAG